MAYDPIASNGRSDPALCGTFGSITGTVKDPSGAALAGARITLTNMSMGIKTALTTGKSGSYRFPTVLPGQYDLLARRRDLSHKPAPGCRFMSMARSALWRRVGARYGLRPRCGADGRRTQVSHGPGVDIWRTKDQSGNSKDVALRNAALEGVGERVGIETADIRALPFPNATFDLVVSSLATRNIRSKADRQRAVAQGFRVLKPGGRIAIADIRATVSYADELRRLGATDIQRQRLGWSSGGAIQSPPRSCSQLQNRPR